MHELYELLFDLFIPKRLPRAFQAVDPARAALFVLLSTLSYYAILLLREVAYSFVTLFRWTRQQLAVSTFWQIGVVLILAANLGVWVTLGG